MIVITGASSGIGEACGRLLAQKKKTLFLLARRKDRLLKLQEEFKNYGSEVHIAVLDVAQRQSVQDWFNQHKERLSQIEVLINNAGMADGLETIDQAKIDSWETMIDTNIKGSLYLIHHLLPKMIKNNLGHIINLGSVAGHHVYPKGNVYCATKHAIHAISQSLRVDLLGKNIRVTEISPGMVETEFSEVRLGNKELAKKVYQGMKPLTAEDVAETILWALERPPHVNIEEIVLYPTAQASPTLVHRQ